MDARTEGLGARQSSDRASPWFVLRTLLALGLFAWYARERALGPPAFLALATAAALVIAHCAVLKVSFFERGFVVRTILSTKTMPWSEMSAVTYGGLRMNGIFTIRALTVRSASQKIKLGSATPPRAHGRILAEAQRRGVYRGTPWQPARQ